MSLTGLLFLLLIAAIVGAIGQMMVGASVGGCLVSIALGFVGALIGGWMAAEFGLQEPFPITIEGQTFPLIWSIIGAALFVAVLSLISGRRRI
ncbi:MAG: GlsB/YeaQ/YmgE family stress response membrane protein [Gemmatimonadota bacterium]